jgi:hypothetical protein
MKRTQVSGPAGWGAPLPPPAGGHVCCVYSCCKACSSTVYVPASLELCCAILCLVGAPMCWRRAHRLTAARHCACCHCHCCVFYACAAPVVSRAAPAAAVAASHHHLVCACACVCGCGCARGGCALCMPASGSARVCRGSQALTITAEPVFSGPLVRLGLRQWIGITRIVLGRGLKGLQQARRQSNGCLCCVPAHRQALEHAIDEHATKMSAGVRRSVCVSSRALRVTLLQSVHAQAAAVCVRVCVCAHRRWRERAHPPLLMTGCVAGQAVRRWPARARRLTRMTSREACMHLWRERAAACVQRESGQHTYMRHCGPVTSRLSSALRVYTTPRGACLSSEDSL